MPFSGYLGLFAVSFLAATLLPAQSELGLSALHVTGDFNLVALILVASLGNTLGSVVNWFLGRGIERLRTKKWFPINEEQLSRAQIWYINYGWPALLLSWVPIIGDPLTVVAGILREPLWRFFLVVAFAKTARYTIVGLLLVVATT